MFKGLKKLFVHSSQESLASTSVSSSGRGSRRSRRSSISSNLSGISTPDDTHERVLKEEAQGSSNGVTEHSAQVNVHTEGIPHNVTPTAAHDKAFTEGTLGGTVGNHPQNASAPQLGQPNSTRVRSLTEGRQGSGSAAHSTSVEQLRESSDTNVQVTNASRSTGATPKVTAPRNPGSIPELHEYLLDEACSLQSFLHVLLAEFGNSQFWLEVKTKLTTFMGHDLDVVRSLANEVIGQINMDIESANSVSSNNPQEYEPLWSPLAFHYVNGRQFLNFYVHCQNMAGYTKEATAMLQIVKRLENSLKMAMRRINFPHALDNTDDSQASYNNESRLQNLCPASGSRAKQTINLSKSLSRPVQARSKSRSNSSRSSHHSHDSDEMIPKSFHRTESKTKTHSFSQILPPCEDSFLESRRRERQQWADSIRASSHQHVRSEMSRAQNRFEREREKYYARNDLNPRESTRRNSQRSQISAQFSPIRPPSHHVHFGSQNRSSVSNQYRTQQSDAPPNSAPRNVTTMGNYGGTIRQNTSEQLASGRPLFTRPNTANLTEKEFLEQAKEYCPADLVDPRVNDAPDEFYINAMPEPFNQPPTREKGSDYFKMLKMNQLKFNGDRTTYIRFRNLFIAHVHTVKMPITYKALALVEALQGVTRLKYLLQNMNYNVLGYLNLILTLEERFGGPQTKIDYCLDQLEVIPQMRENNVVDLENFVDKAYNFVDTMRSYDRFQECCTRAFDRLIEKKLPPLYESFYQNWLQSTQRPRNGLTIIDWCHIELQSRQKSLRASSEMSSTFKPKFKDFRSRNHNNNTFQIVEEEDLDESDTEDVNLSDGMEKEKLCPLCKVHHWLRDCPKFLAMSKAQRRQFLRKNNRCYKCLRTGHTTKDCPSSIKCPDCDGNHHRLIHGSRDAHSQWEKAFKKNRPKNPKEHTTVVDEEPEATDEEGDSSTADLPDNSDDTVNLCEDKAETFLNTGDHLKNKVSVRHISAFAQNSQGKKIKVNVILDECSTITLISTRLRDHLNLTGKKVHLKVNGVTGHKSEFDQSSLVKLKLLSLDGSFSKEITAKSVPNPAGNMQILDWNNYKKHWKHISHLQFPQVTHGVTIDIIIGTDRPTLCESLSEIPGKNDLEPFARLTRLGWTAVGPLVPQSEHRDDRIAEDSTLVVDSFVSDASDNYVYVFSTQNDEQTHVFTFGSAQNSPLQSLKQGREGHEHERPTSSVQRLHWGGPQFSEYFFSCQEVDTEISQLLQRSMALETFPGDEKEVNEPSVDEKEALQGLIQSRKKVGDKYRVGVMWKKGEPDLPNNYTYAYKRQLGLEKSKHLDTKEKREMYNKVFFDWIAKKYVQKVEGDRKKLSYVWYLPHFPVVRIDRTTTKIRPVLDGAARVALSSGDRKGLNDCVHVGPKVINDLCVVLLRFRANPIAIGGDVQEMFLQIQMEEQDRQYHRFLFREHPEDKLEEYEFLVHCFGNRGSPCVSIFVIKEHAKDNKEKFPRASETILESTIVDDNMDSVNTVEEAIQLIADLKVLYKGCGMNIRKFMSNSPEVLQSVPESERASNIDLSHITTLESGNLPLVKTLGVVWVALDDEFTFVVEPPLLDIIWTMRKCLQCAHRIFDPLGFITPFIVLARLHIQSYWREKLGWDDPLPDQLAVEWCKWAKEIEDLPHIKVPRCLRGTGQHVQKQELHVFTDASTKAYAAVAYLVTTYPNETVSHIVMAKAKVCPLKPMTVPRLELVGARLGILLARQVNQALKLEETNIHFWTDSLNVLFWLHSTSKNLKSFVANRVIQILDFSSLDNWHWVPTDQNPADLPSRGLLIHELTDLRLWWHGPEFLLQSPEHWPVQERLQKPDKASDEMKCLVVDEKKDINGFCIEYHSKFAKLLRVLSCPFYWLLKTRGESNSIRDSNVQKKVFLHIFRAAQREALGESLEEIKKHGQVLLKNPLSPLCPELDQDGILRVHGRLELAKHLSFESRHPIILPKQHKLAVLIIRHAHEIELKHVGGVNHVLAHLNMKYWIMGGRVLVKKVLRECVRCRQVQAHPTAQKISPLPDFRISDSEERLAAFSTVGIDCAGPFLTKQGGRRSREKRYMLLFCCAQYRAVHIEMLFHLDANSFLMALTRFCARRNRPDKIVSDNGRNFVRGDGELTELWDLLKDNPELRKKYPKIEWKFNTPHCPHAGGLFERFIRSAKTSFYKIVGPSELNDEELQTTFNVVEGILNSRPISILSDDPNDLPPLTPAHFLGIGKPFQALAPVPSSMSLSSRWHHLERLMDMYWSRFIKECLSKLQKLPKWVKTRENPEVGDVVIVLEEKFRGVWPLGRIVDTWKNRDGLVRSVDVDFNGRVLKRDIQKIVILIKQKQ